MLEIALFITGAAVMVLEIAGSRVLAPYIGVSIFVWTSLIGVILGCLSFGYWLGGRSADRNPAAKNLAAVIASSGIFTIIIPLIKDFILAMFAGIHNVRLGAPLATLVLFGPPSVLLGVVVPYAARLRMLAVEDAGRTVGRLYAVSTVGSITGTFLAGFYLVPTFTNKNIFILLGITLIATGAALRTKIISLRRIVVLTILIAAAIFSDSSFLALNQSFEIEEIKDTAYSTALIFRDSAGAAKPARYLATDPVGIQSGIFLDGGDELVGEYAKFFRLVGYFVPEAKRVLMIGGGGYSYPKDFLKNFPDATIEVVEIDPQITDLAKKYFNLPDNPRLIVRHEDGRIFLNGAAEKSYDAVLLDAFNGCTTPYHLSTIEAVRRIHASLKERGAVILNMIGSISGENSEFIRREYATYKEIFDFVYLFAVSTQNPIATQNIVLVAIKGGGEPNFEKSDSLYKTYFDRLLTGTIEGKKPLTDEYAPVEYFYRKICSTPLVGI